MEKDEQLVTEEIQEEAALQPVSSEKPAKGKAMRDNKGVAVVEIILILVVLIALVIIFRDQIMALVNTIWNDINGDANTLL